MSPPAALRTRRRRCFRASTGPAGRLSGRPLARRPVLAMIKRRAAAAGLPASTCCHTFRATGITTYMANGGTLEHAQRIAGHASPKTTKLYDRTADTISLRRDLSKEVAPNEELQFDLRELKQIEVGTE